MLVLAAGAGRGQNPPDLSRQLQELRRQNEQLQQQLLQQQELIEKLTEKVSRLEGAEERRAADSASLKEGAGVPSADRGLLGGPLKAGNVVLSGEAGLAFFRSEAGGHFPNNEFRVDEAKLFLDARVWKDVFFFTELNLTQREEQNEDVRLGEIYVDFEDVSQLWGKERWLNLRVGRLDIPFGEEYLARDAIDNPLISHSLSDLWGVDEGVELYGSAGRFQYVLAVQNGGRPTLRDFTSDKAVVGRVGYDPNRWLHLSLSALRTGDLDVKNDRMSELWFGNGFIRALGPAATTTRFHADLAEGDVQARWRRGHVKSAGGYLRTGDKVRVVFQDNGPGIPAENLLKIFDPFFTTKEVGKGTGLGLSLCYGMIQEHGGTISVHSPVGEGATFVIELPVATADEAASAQSKSDQQRSAAPLEGRGKKVLVIDDEPALLEMIRATLSGNGYEVDTAGDGETALRLLKHSRYNVTLCDWKMPGLNGQQVFERVVATDPAAAQRFVFMTGDVVNERVQAFLEERQKICLAKPFTLEDFRATVKKVSEAG
ncbi:MAG: response regulator [Verrucomicrobia bacterium]|nr:response regulator [Verrucomicrobiota bacterium]